MERLFEEVFVEVCAPTLRGIKPSNLFRYQPQNRDKLLEALDFWNRELEPLYFTFRHMEYQVLCS